MNNQMQGNNMGGAGAASQPKNNMYLYIIIGVVVVIILAVVIWYFAGKTKRAANTKCKDQTDGTVVKVDDKHIAKCKDKKAETVTQCKNGIDETKTPMVCKT